MQPPHSARSVTVAALRLGKWLDGFADRHGPWQVEAEPEQVLVRGQDGDRAWIEVPFPPLNDLTIRGLLDHVRQERRIAVLLVRRGGHAAGIFHGATLLQSKVGTSYVQGTTKAGGWSQQRYARRRANQSAAAFADAADVAVRIFHGARFEHLVLGGDREAVKAVLADQRLAHLGPLVGGPWLAVKDPRLRVLEATPEQFLAVRIALDP
jgi:hypothetical protein